MVDLHSHLLDDLDRKPDDIVKSLRYAKGRGYSKVVFTPKVRNVKNDCLEYNDMMMRFKEVEQLMKEEHLDLDVSLGAEIVAYKGIVEDLTSCQKLYGISKYLVIDISRYRSSIDELAYMLSLRGFKPIFSGVEKTSYKHLHVHTKKWHDSGAEILVTAKHMFGTTLEATRVKKLIRHNQVDYVSSGKTKFMNPFIMLKLAKFYVTCIVGPHYAKEIFSMNARGLLQSKSIMTT